MSVLKLGTNKFSKMLLGSGVISRAYLGSTQIFPSTWTPEDIEVSNQEGWWDFSDLSTIDDSTDPGFCQQLDDKFATARHMTTSTLANKPRTGSDTVNGLNVGESHDGERKLSHSGFPVTDGNSTIISFTRIDAVNHNNDSNFSWDSSNDYQVSANIQPVYNPYVVFADGNFTFADAPFTGILNSTIFQQDFDEGTATAHANGRLQGSLPYTSQMGASGNLRWFSNRGGSRSPTGVMCEMIAVTKMTEDLQWKIEGYIHHKWEGAGALNSLPYSHPHKFTKPFAGVASVPLFTIEDLDTNIWLDADNKDSVEDRDPGSPFNRLRRWHDGKVNGLIADQGTNSLQPDIFPNGLNNMTTIGFNGVGYRMTIASLTLTGEHSIFAVAMQNGSGVNYQEILRGDPVDEDMHFGGRSDHHFSVFYGDGATWDDVGDVTPVEGASGVWRLQSVVTSGGVAQPYFDGVAKDTKVCSMTSISNFFLGSAGSANLWTGEMAEIIVIPYAVTDDERQRIEGQLAWKWGRVAQLPSNHLYKHNPPTRNLWTALEINPGAWYDFTELQNTNHIISNGEIEQWGDKGLGALHISQNTASKRPSISRIYNGLNVADFDPTVTDRSLENSTVSGFPFQQIDIFYLMKKDTVTGDYLFTTNGSGSSQLRGNRDANYDWELVTEDDGQSGVNDNTGDTGVHLLNFRWDGSTLYLFVDGSSKGTPIAQIGTCIVDDYFRIGADAFGGNGHDGFIGEIVSSIVFHSDEMRQRLEGYLMHKFGIEANLPGGHPYLNSPPKLTTAKELFRDTFNRANSTDLNSLPTGKYRSHSPTGALSWVQVSGGAGGSEILTNSLKMGDNGAGADWAIAYVDHNFIDAEIIANEKFTVEADVSITGTAGGTRFVGFGLGIDKATLDAWSANNPSIFDIDFFIGYDPTGTKEVKIFADGVEVHQQAFNLDAGGNLKVVFTNVLNFDASTTINYEAFVDDVSIKTGTFDWSGTDENYITTYSNISTDGGIIDNFKVETE